MARETGDVGALARRREQSRVVQAGLADDATQGDRTRLLVAAAQDQSIQQEIALQQRIKDPEGTRGKTTQELFDQTLIEDLEGRLATETDPLERARIEQQIEDIKAPGLEDLQKEAVELQKNQLAVQQLIAANQQLLLQAQLADTEEQREVLKEKLAENTQKLEDLLKNNEQQATTQQEQAETQQRQLESQQEQVAGAAGAVGATGAAGAAGAAFNPEDEVRKLIQAGDLQSAQALQKEITEANKLVKPAGAGGKDPFAPVESGLSGFGIKARKGVDPRKIRKDLKLSKSDQRFLEKGQFADKQNKLKKASEDRIAKRNRIDQELKRREDEARTLSSGRAIPGPNIADAFRAPQGPTLKDLAQSPRTQANILEDTLGEFQSLFGEFGAKIQENAQVMLDAADMQNAAGEKQIQAADTMPTNISHNMNTIEVNGLGNLANGIAGFANDLGQITQNLIDSKNPYEGAPEQGDGVSPRNLG